MSEHPSESAITAAIVRRLREHPETWYVKTHGAGWGRIGVPDILACIAGRFLAIEVKRSGGRLTRMQHHELEQIEAADGIVLVATCVEDVDACLADLNHAIAEDRALA